MAIKPVSERPPERQVRPEHLGVFSARRGGALAGVTGNTIGQWARRGLIEPSIYAGRPANRYAFYDVAEAIVVHWLHKEHFSYEEIRRAIAAAREDYPNWPLVTAPLGIARHALAGDRGLIVQRIGDGYVEVGRAGRQVILRPQLLDFARDMLRTGGWLANELQLARVEVDPQKLGGAPTVRGRRWPVERVARIAADPPGRALLSEDYGLDERDVDESIKWTLAASSL